MRIRNKRVRALWTQRGVRERIAAGVLGVSKYTLRKWRRLGKGPDYYNFEGDCVRYPIDGLHAYMKRAKHLSCGCCTKKERTQG